MILIAAIEMKSDEIILNDTLAGMLVSNTESTEVVYRRGFGVGWTSGSPPMTSPCSYFVFLICSYNLIKQVLSMSYMPFQGNRHNLLFEGMTRSNFLCLENPFNSLIFAKYVQVGIFFTPGIPNRDYTSNLSYARLWRYPP